MRPPNTDVFNQTKLKWETPSDSVFELTPEEVHVWSVSFEHSRKEIPSFWSLLSSGEKARADRYYFEKDKNQLVMVHGFLRTLLAKYIKFDPTQLTFAEGAKGKPFLTGLPPQKILFFNLSHSKDFGLIAISRRFELGVDVEFMDKKRESKKIARRFFSPGEVEAIESNPEPLRLRAFFHYWTLKESFIKGVGEGLHLPLPKVEIQYFEDSGKLGVKYPGLSGAPQWELMVLPSPAPAYAAALAVKGKGFRVRCFKR